MRTRNSASLWTRSIAWLLPRSVRASWNPRLTVAGSGQSQAVRVAGWVWDREHQRPPSAIVITEDGIITGLGAVGEWRPMTLVDNHRIKDGYIGYAGYARVVQPDTPLKVYAILRGSPQSACYFATAESSASTVRNAACGMSLAIRIHSDVK